MPESELAQKVMEKDNEIKNLSELIVGLEDKLRQNGDRPKSSISKDVQTSQLENQIHEMTLYVNEQEQKLSMKDYEINGLRERIGLLEEEVQRKN